MYLHRSPSPRITPSHLLLASLCAAGLTACDKEKELVVDTGNPERITEHCGDITDTEAWAASGNKHVLTCDVRVTGTLELQAGVEIYIDPGFSLIIDGGVLTALGSDMAPILITTHSEFPAAGDHGGLSAIDATIESTWLTMFYGGLGGAPMVNVQGGVVSFEDLEISNGLGDGLVIQDATVNIIDGLNSAYLQRPIVIPWTAAAVLGGDITMDSVEQAAIVFPDKTISAEVILPEQSVPYYSEGVHVESTGFLQVDPGAILDMAGDIVVDGSIIVWGDTERSSTVRAVESTAPSILVGPGAAEVKFRYASLEAIPLVNDFDMLLFKDSAIIDAPDVALTLNGGIYDNSYANFTNNRFEGEGYGLLMGVEDLQALGFNEYKESAFNGPVIMGGELSVDLDLKGFDDLLIDGDLSVTGANLILSKGALFFSDGVGMRVQDGSLTATAVSFDHLGSVAGGWKGLSFETGSEASVLDGCDIAHGGADKGANLVVWSNATVRNSTIRDSAGWGVLLNGKASPTLENILYKNNALGDVGP